MPELIMECQRKASKDHECSFCGRTIRKGEIYEYQKLKDDGFYEWKSHTECDMSAGELYAWVEPIEGMTQEDFQEACSDFCMEFVCPSCEKYDHEKEGCLIRPSNCIEKVYQHLKTHDFKRIAKDGCWFKEWACVPKQAKEETP